MSQPMAYNSLDGALWVFPKGPNHEGFYLGCADADAVAAPEGDITLTMCFNGKGKWETVGKKKAPPGAVTTTITTLTYRQRNYLEKLKCEFGLMFLQNDGGRSDLFCNHQRATILDGVNITSRTIDNLMKREDEADTTHAFALSANPPAIETAEIEGNRQGTSEESNFNDVYMIKGDCAPCLEGVAVADGAGVYAPSEVWLTHDGGQTWTLTPTSPFFAVQDLTSVILVDMCNGIRRIIVAQRPAGGTQGMTAFSDDNGATWTEVNLGGATDGAGALQGFWAIDSRHIWLASAGGFIFFSADGGETWTIQENAVITNLDYFKVAFAEDGLHGYAISSNGIVAVTTNGGASWTAATVISGTPTLHGLAVVDDEFAWVGDATGGLWFTEDGGTTWTQRTGFVGSGSFDITAIAFVNDWVGFMIAQNASSSVSNVYRTIDGGLSWDIISADPNAGLNALAACDPNYAVVVGNIYAGFGFVEVVEE